MNIKKEKTSLIIPLVSGLVILAFFGLTFTYRQNFSAAILEEIGPMLTQMSMLIPAVLGLWKFTNRGVNKWVVGGYIVYGLLLFLGGYNVLTANDPLAAGLPMVLIVLPFSILFSIYLIKQLKES